MVQVYADNYRCENNCGYTTYVATGIFYKTPPKCPRCEAKLVPIS